MKICCATISESAMESQKSHICDKKRVRGTNFCFNFYYFPNVMVPYFFAVILVAGTQEAKVQI